MKERHERWLAARAAKEAAMTDDERKARNVAICQEAAVALLYGA